MRKHFLQVLSMEPVRRIFNKLRTDLRYRTQTKLDVQRAETRITHASRIWAAGQRSKRLGSASAVAGTGISKKNGTGNFKPRQTKTERHQYEALQLYEFVEKNPEFMKEIQETYQRWEQKADKKKKAHEDKGEGTACIGSAETRPYAKQNVHFDTETMVVEDEEKVNDSDNPLDTWMAEDETTAHVRNQFMGMQMGTEEGTG
jgi:hypothetical protein